MKKLNKQMNFQREKNHIKKLKQKTEKEKVKNYENWRKRKLAQFFRITQKALELKGKQLKNPPNN